jgi:hypothetical protein
VIGAVGIGIVAGMVELGKLVLGPEMSDPAAMMGP